MTDRPDLVGHLIDAWTAWDHHPKEAHLARAKEDALRQLHLPPCWAHDLIAAHRRSTVLTHGTEHRGHSVPDAITSMILELAPHLLDHDQPEAA